MRRAAAWTFVALAAGCTPDPVDFTVDAAELAHDFPLAVLTVELVLNADVVQHVDLDLSETDQVTFADAILPVQDYGVAAFADMDADGKCEPGSDLGWWIIYTPAPKVDFVWVPDPTTLRDDGYACTWFGDLVISDDTGADTDSL